MDTHASVYSVGLDIGSTTAKIAIADKTGKLTFSDYQRHNTRVYETIDAFIKKAIKQCGDLSVKTLITGSAGMGISEKTGLSFIQEVVATEEVIRRWYPDVKTVIDIGGEDSKMIFLNDTRMPDIRMNGNCAGGTGAFIDQIATLLNTPIQELNALAAKHRTIYPIASRCGVFAKTDVQNLISRKIPSEDIAASIFHAVAIQCMNTLARGFDITPQVLLCGGPFTFLPELGRIFLKAVKLTEDDCVKPSHPELLPALGASLVDRESKETCLLSDLRQRLSASRTTVRVFKNRLKPLFEDPTQFEGWKQDHTTITIEKTAVDAYSGTICFLGIDSGSTTTKITMIGESNELLFSWYRNNHGNPVNTVIEGLREVKALLDKKRPDLTIAKSAVTGYGEDLIKAAFGIDKGMVETIAHYTAAKYVSPDVSFILDIGGQDMKAIFVENGVINRIELNEACSSGCGSFIETFGNSLDYPVSEFAELACHAEAPCDLGTRCTVFMNSKVKQSLRENASVEEISAGLAYSVIKNCLFKVLKLTSMDELGDHVVLQGGTFKNPSVIRAMELLSGKDVKCTDIPELMGAYGAALIARQEYETVHRASSFIGLDMLDSVQNYKTRQVLCKGCENLCSVTRFTFDNKASFFSGNKCEKFFTNRGEVKKQGNNLFEYKQQLLFERDESALEKPVFTIGIPRTLGIYESYPFWSTFFRACDIEVKLSSQSTMKLYEKGLGTVMSDSICFPAKLTHGHIVDLFEKQVDRVFYPLTFYELKEFEDSLNSFNCPIVSSYGEVIESAMSPDSKHGIPLDKPIINFKDPELLKRSCYDYLKPFGVSKRTVRKAVDKGLAAQTRFKVRLREKAAELIARAQQSGSLLIVLAGRPYHLDPLINHKSPEILASLGVDVITEDSIPLEGPEPFDGVHVLSQWSYPNRIYHAADWTARQPDNIQLIQFNSFGCGPDALVTDETKEILKTGKKNYTLIKIDEITSTGSVRLRLRSMIESLKLRSATENHQREPRINTRRFEIEDKYRTILAPHFADSYSPLVPSLFKAAGYHVEVLPEPDKESVEIGLRYSNNDICFPATVIVGDIIKALQSGKYDRNSIAVGITQTGGQCRASNYLALIKKAMLAAGFEDIPVISVTLADGLNDQPGFEVNWLKLAKLLYVAMIYADSLAKMYFATVVREQSTGDAKTLHKNYLRLVEPYIVNKDCEGILELLEQAVRAFNAIPVKSGHYPKIGIVGEIYVKYNAFGHQYITDWLIKQGIEVVVPPLIDFFTQDFVNVVVNRKTHLRRSNFADLLVKGLEWYMGHRQKGIDKILSKFRFDIPFDDISHIADKASKILSLSNQFGEGWLIAAEIAAFADAGINNVVSLQPFGCIANHVVSKGVETRIKEYYPEMNLLFLDFEAGTSEVNVLNRLYFMIKSVCDKQVVA